MKLSDNIHKHVYDKDGKCSCGHSNPQMIKSMNDKEDLKKIH